MATARKGCFIWKSSKFLVNFLYSENIKPIVKAIERSAKVQKQSRHQKLNLIFWWLKQKKHLTGKFTFTGSSVQIKGDWCERYKFPELQNGRAWRKKLDKTRTVLLRQWILWRNSKQIILSYRKTAMRLDKSMRMMSITDVINIQELQ